MRLSRPTAEPTEVQACTTQRTTLRPPLDLDVGRRVNEARRDANLAQRADVFVVRNDATGRVDHVRAALRDRHGASVNDIRAYPEGPDAAYVLDGAATEVTPNDRLTLASLIRVAMDSDGRRMGDIPVRCGCGAAITRR